METLNVYQMLLLFRTFLIVAFAALLSLIVIGAVLSDSFEISDVFGFAVQFIAALFATNMALSEYRPLVAMRPDQNVPEEQDTR